MLATAAQDANYLRNRRFYTIQSIRTSRKTIEQIKNYLIQNDFDISEATIIDDLKNFTSIGLEVDENDLGFLIKDEIECLEIPNDVLAVTQRANISVVKDRVREQLHNVSHRYLALLDLSYNSSADREFEIETMALLTDELDYQGLHLGGSRRPDGLFFKDTNGVIVDTKAYANGYNLPIPQADEMIRYIEENKNRGNLNPNLWWKQFNDSVASYSFLFVSSEFKGHFRDNIQYINHRTGYDGGVISAENLLLFAEKVYSGELSYADSFGTLRCNNEVVITA